MKTLLCAIGKLENHYIREWVEYHKNIGFSNILLYDNNDINGESFSDVIDDYISSGYVIIKNYRGLSNAQIKSYNDCYHEYKNQYDWIGFWDIDEFIELENNDNIQNFLEQEIFKNVQCIRLCWKQYTDNNLIEVCDDNYSVLNRFTEIFSKDYCLKNNIPFENYLIANTQTKSIVKTDINDFNISSPHVFLKVPTVNAIGQHCNNERVNLDGLPIWKNAWINHYRFKTLEEFINNKMFRGWPTPYMNGGKNYLNIKLFLKFNALSDEKRNYIIQHTNYDDSKIYVNSFVKLNKQTGEILPNNWGDELNFNFLSKLFNKDVVLYDGNCRANYTCIGSIITDNYINNYTIIWGAGIQNSNYVLKNKPKKVCAVRGPLTREFLLKNNIDCPEVYGDPALLLPSVYKPKIEKKYKIGIIPHWQTGLLDDYNISSNKHILIIDMHNYNNWTDVIDEILSCDYIVSESLHGLIIAEAYGIPNLWIDIKLNNMYDIKFHDFFLSLGIDREKSFYLSPFTNINDLLQELSKYKKGIIPDLIKLKKSLL